MLDKLKYEDLSNYFNNKIIKDIKININNRSIPERLYINYKKKNSFFLRIFKKYKIIKNVITNEDKTINRILNEEEVNNDTIKFVEYYKKYDNSILDDLILSSSKNTIYSKINKSELLTDEQGDYYRLKELPSILFIIFDKERNRTKNKRIYLKDKNSMINILEFIKNNKNIQIEEDKCYLIDNKIIVTNLIEHNIDLIKNGI